MLHQYLESNFFSKASILKDEIIPLSKINSDLKISEIDKNKIYEYKVSGESRTFMFKTSSDMIYSCIFTTNKKIPVDALKTTFGPIKKEFLDSTLGDLRNTLETRDVDTRVSSNTSDIKKIFSVIYTILRKIYYPKYTKIAFRAILLPSEKPFKELYDEIKEKNELTIKHIIEIINSKEKQIQSKLKELEDSEVLKRFNKLKESFLKKLNSINGIISKEQLIQLFNGFEKQAFFRHRLYKSAINLSMKEIEKEINQAIKVEFDYDKTDRYIVINIGK